MQKRPLPWADPVSEPPGNLALRHEELPIRARWKPSYPPPVLANSPGRIGRRSAAGERRERLAEGPGRLSAADGLERLLGEGIVGITGHIRLELVTESPVAHHSERPPHE